MKQVFFDWVVLPIDDHDRDGFAAGYAQIENGVVARLAMQDLIDFFGLTATGTDSPPAPYSTPGVAR